VDRDDDLILQQAVAPSQQRFEERLKERQAQGCKLSALIELPGGVQRL
jgi:hypothetical protein